MSAFLFSSLFIFFLCSSVIVRLWLGYRQIKCVKTHKNSVPEQFSSAILLSEHQKAADYTVDKTRFSLFSLIVDTVLLILLTVLGGMHMIATYIYSLLGMGIVAQIVFIVVIGVLGSIISLPLDYYRQFVIEQRYGFNKMNHALFFKDLLKNVIVSAVIGLPLLAVLLFVMQSAGHYWWLYAWILWSAFQIIMLLIYPSWIAPIFNKFIPLSDQTLRERIESLMQRVGFQSQGLFVMDGSKRSAHGNAYFTGFGSSKRVVFFDTLLKSLSNEEVEAVLAHELGHFKLHHVLKRIISTSFFSLILLALLGYLKNCDWFYLGLGVGSELACDATALVLFMLIFPVFSFCLVPLMSIVSRKQEFEADSFSAEYADANQLVSALVKMYADNASTLTPDPIYSAFYDSHPHASIRISHLLQKNKGLLKG